MNRTCGARRPSARSAGQALTEFVILCLAIVPLFLAIPVLAGYFDLKHRSQQASRYAVWERTVWSPEAGAWKNGGAQAVKPDARLQKEVDRRIFNHPLHPLQDEEVSEDPLWTDHAYGRLVRDSAARDESGNPQSYRVLTRGSLDDTPVRNPLVDPVASDGIPFVGEALAGILQALDGILDALPIDTECRFEAVDAENGLNLSRRSYARVDLSVPLEVALAPAAAEQMSMTPSAAILSNSWAAPDEDMFRDRVGRAVTNEWVDCITWPLSTFFGFFALGTNEVLFGEVRPASPAGMEARTNVLLPEYKGG